LKVVFRNKKGQFVKGKPLPKEIIEKRKKTMIGKKYPEEIYPNKGMRERKHSEETKRKMSESHKGISVNKGRKLTKEERQKISERMRGSKNHFWKGGVTPENLRIRARIEYRLWREAVYARDNFTCQKCKEKGSKELRAHHILNFATHLNIRFAIDNGITLCKNCHQEFHKIYGNRNNTREQLEEFLKAQ